MRPARSSRSGRLSTGFRRASRPNWTALMMVAKLSSVRIMIAASFETSVPVIPMATPMSAFLSAARRSRRRRSSTRCCPGAGATGRGGPCLRVPLGRRRRCPGVGGRDSSSVRAANSAPVSASPSMPSSRPIAAAVTAWSPVIIRTWMPALWHLAIAALASALGGVDDPDHGEQRQVLDEFDQVPVGIEGQQE